MTLTIEDADFMEAPFCTVTCELKVSEALFKDGSLHGSAHLNSHMEIKGS